MSRGIFRRRPVRRPRRNLSWLGVAAVAGTRFTDAFAGTDGAEIDGRTSDTGSGTWDVLRGIGIAKVLGNEYAPVNTVEAKYALAVIGNSGTDQSASITNSSGTNYPVAVGVRIDNTYTGNSLANGYWASRISATQIRIWSGTTPITTVIKNYAAGETIYIQAVGTEVTVKHNGTTIYGPLTPTATQTSGRVGVALYNATALDDFDGGVYVVPSSGSKPFFFSRLLRRRVA